MNTNSNSSSGNSSGIYFSDRDDKTGYTTYYAEVGQITLKDNGREVCRSDDIDKRDVQHARNIHKHQNKP